MIKLLHGDCLELMKNIPDNSIDLILTDPPYGTTACKWDSIIPLDLMWKQLKRAIKPNGAVVMTAGQPFTSVLVMSNVEMWRYELVWDKQRCSDFLNANRKPLNSHENIQVFYIESPTYNKQTWYSEPYKKTINSSLSDCYGNRGVALSESIDGARCPLSIISLPRDGSRLHPTQKPVALMSYLIKTYTNEGDTVLDFCCGSGTTGVACKRWNREYILIEKEAEYCDIARRRLEAEDNLFSEAENC